MTSAQLIWRLRHRKATVARDLLLVVGLAIFAGMSWEIGMQQIFSYLQPLGGRVILVFLPYLLVFMCDTVGWRYAFEHSPPVGFIRLLAIQIAGKAANIVTPLVPVGGEPVKAYLLQTSGVPFTEGLAAAVIARTVATIAQGLFVLAVTGLTVVHVGLPAPLMKAIAAVFMILGLLVGTFLFAQTRGLFASLLGMVQKLKLGISSFLEGARDLDRRLASYYRHRKGRLLLSMTFHLLGWLVEGVEVHLLLSLLALPSSAVVALAIVALSSAVRAASFMIPGSLGVQEGGNVFIFASFGLPPEAAMAFSILRRLREWGWSAVGFLFLTRFGLEQRLPVASASSRGR